MSVVDPNLPPHEPAAELQELLAREAVFFMSRKRIGDALSAARQGKAAKLFVKPLLSLFGAASEPVPDSRSGRAGGSDSLPESVELLEAGLKKIEHTCLRCPRAWTAAWRISCASMTRST
jgi:hypothetical protein